MIMRLYIFNVVLISGLFIGCGGGSSSSGDDSTKSFKGKLSSVSTGTKNLKSINPRALSDIGDISEILAVPIKDGKADLSLTKTVPVSSDSRNFEVEFSSDDLESDTKWVFMMAKDSNTIEDKIVSFVSMSQGDNAMSSFPMSGITGDIDLGELSLNGSETNSTKSISDNADNFTQEEAELLQMAKLDNSEKMIMNKYINTNTQTGIKYEGNIRFWYDANLSKNQFFNVASYDYKGYRFQIDTNKYTQSAFTSICNGDKRIKFLPPENIVIVDTNVTVTNATPFNDLNLVMSGSNTACLDSNTTFGPNIYNDGISYEMQAIKGKTIPKGYWKFKENEITVAAFDFAVGSIFNQDETLNIFLPSLKFEVDDNDKITKILVEWYRFDKELSQYIKVVNDSLISGFASSLQINFTDQNGTTGTRIEESINLGNDTGSVGNIITKEITEFQNNWYYKGHNIQSDLTLDGIVINIIFSEGVQVSIGF